MRLLICVIFTFMFPVFIHGQESVILPSRLERLKDQKIAYERHARKLIERYWEAQYHYDKNYIRAILDTIEIVCIPSCEIDVYKNPNQDFTQLQTFLAFAKPVKKDSYHLFFNGNRYVGGTVDTPLYTYPGITGDSLVHTKRGNRHEKLALRILEMKPEFSFVVAGIENAIWFVLPGNRLMVYEIDKDKLSKPQEYLNQFKPEDLRLFLSFHTARIS